MTEFSVIEPGSFSEWIWDSKYRFKESDGTPIDRTVDDTFIRVAGAVSGAEKPSRRDQWSSDFFEVMRRFEFIPAGRILAGAGTNRGVTLFNCYVMGAIEDSLSGIYDAVKEAALTMKQGGGVGMDFSTLRYRGAPVKTVGSESSGAVSFMESWDTMCKTIMSSGARRGAMMGVLRCDHPDIEEFISAKRKGGRLTNFNISVAVTDDFITALSEDGPWDLKFGGKVIRTLKNARVLWDEIMRSTYECADPGVLFIDRINEENPLRAIETISASNPCGEQMLPPYGACLLGSINLTRFVRDPFTQDAWFDYVRLAEVVPIAVRFLDNVIDISKYPLRQQLHEATRKRRIGLGITGLADALVMLGLRYQDGTAIANNITHNIARLAEDASQMLAAEKGAFPAWDEDLGFPVRRNSHLTSIAPTGTISLFAGNVSSGIEPIFGIQAKRKVLLPDGTKREFEVIDYAYRLWLRVGTKLGVDWATADQLTPSEHLAMVAACKPNVDSAISKTINCPESISFEDFKGIYSEAYRLGLKGCTTYRPNEITGSVLSKESDKAGEGKAEGPSESTKVIPLHGGPISRPRQLPGVTYKIKPSEHALYVTVCDIWTEDGRRPFEVFFNSKQVDGYDWAVALSRMISAIFRKGGDVAFVVEELRSVFSPRGGFWADQKYQPSICAAIGDILDEHMRSIGFLAEETEPVVRAHSLGAAAVVATQQIRGGPFCPKCQTGVLYRREGCTICASCDYSKC